MKNRGLTRTRLRIALVALLLALAAPIVVLVLQAQQQMRREAFYQYRGMADELGQRIDAALRRAIADEQARSVDDYRFALGTLATSNVLQRSPLERFPPQSPLPGVAGYFQIDADGVLDAVAAGRRRAVAVGPRGERGARTRGRA